MSDALLPGMSPATGSFAYREEEIGQVAQAVSHAEFSLYCNLEIPGQIDLNLMVAAQPHEIEAPDDAEETHLLEPAVTVQWLTIDADRLRGCGPDALDGFTEQFKATSATAGQPPAAIECGFLGMVTEMDLRLTHHGGNYRAALRATDEMGRAVDIDARLPLFQITVRGEDGAADPAAEAWLTTHFDTDLMDTAWRVRGSGEHTWQVLEARFKETEL